MANAATAKALYLRLDFGRDRLPNLVVCVDGDRSLIFLTLPLMDRRLCVTAPPSLRSLCCSEDFLREGPPATAP